MKMHFYKCAVCGQIVGIIKKTDSPLICCGQEMSELTPCSVDASHEKHVPEIVQDGHKVFVSVGSKPHPMTDDHYIEWIALETKYGAQRVVLHPDDEPAACFRMCHGDEIIAVYAYCNLHGLWKTTG